MHEEMRRELKFTTKNPVTEKRDSNSGNGTPKIL